MMMKGKVAGICFRILKLTLFFFKLSTLTWEILSPVLHSLQTVMHIL